MRVGSRRVPDVGVGIGRRPMDLLQRRGAADQSQALNRRRGQVLLRTLEPDEGGRNDAPQDAGRQLADAAVDRHQAADVQAGFPGSAGIGETLGSVGTAGSVLIRLDYRVDELQSAFVRTDGAKHPQTIAGGDGVGDVRLAEPHDIQLTRRVANPSFCPSTATPAHQAAADDLDTEHAGLAALHGGNLDNL